MSQSPDSIVLRQATPADVPGILGMVKELCCHEGENPEETITVTESELLEDGFGKDACYGCIVAEDTSNANDRNHTLIGHAIYSKSYSAWKGRSLYLDDFYIKEGYRGKGLGKRIMKRLAQRFNGEGGCSARDLILKPDLHYAENDGGFRREMQACFLQLFKRKCKS